MAGKNSDNLTKEQLFVVKRLVWHGVLRRKEVEALLQISSDFASRLIGQVRKFVGMTLEGKAYLPNGGVPGIVSGGAFLEDVRRSLIAGTSMENEAGTVVPAFVLSAPDQHVDSDVLRDIVRAVQSRRGVAISYTGMNLGDITRTREIEPVAFMLINDRWHVHAYSLPDAVAGLEGGWRDFVLSRISVSYGLMHEATHCIEDSEGMELLEFRLAPHPKLTDDQKDVITKAWNMSNGCLTMRMTQNQFFYFEQQYVAREGEGPPKRLLVKLPRGE